MTKYKTLDQVLGINPRDLSQLTEFFNLVNSVHSDTLNLVNNVLDKGFLNPGENAYFYGVGAAAARIQSMIDRLDTLLPNNDLLERYQQSLGTLLMEDFHYSEFSVTPIDTWTIRMRYRPFHTYEDDDQYSYAKLLAMTDGDADYNHIYGFVPLTNLDMWIRMGIISDTHKNDIINLYGSEGNSRGMVALLSNLDISTFLFSLMLTMSYRGENQDFVLEILNSPTFRRLGGLQIPYLMWNPGSLLPQPNEFNPGYTTGYNIKYTDVNNLILMYKVGTGAVTASLFFDPSFGGVIAPISNDVWLTAFMLKECLMQNGISEVASLLNNIQSLSQDFVQAGFDESASYSDMCNWIYNYINMNFPSNMCTVRLKAGETKLKTLDPISQVF